MLKLLSIFTGVRYGRYDKVVHFFASAAIAVILLPVLPVPLAAAVSFGVGVAKEFLDLLWQKSQFGWMDLAADLVGVVVVAALYIMLLGMLARGSVV